jgi:hypothetical protein
VQMSYHNKWEWYHYLGAGLVTLGCILILIWFIWFHITHKCVETRVDTCSSTECIMHDDNGGCSYWHTKTYPCTTCVRYERRNPLPAEAN